MAVAPPIPVAPPADRKLAAAIAARVGAARYALWFEGHARFVGLGAETVVVARNDQSRDWLEHTFGRDVRDAAAETGVGGVRWAVDPGLFGDDEDAAGRGPRAAEEVEVKPAPAAAKPAKVFNFRERISGGAAVATTPPPVPAVPAAERPRLDLFGDPLPTPKPKSKKPDADAAEVARPAARPGRRWKLLSDFVVGPSNRVAFASAVSVVEEPGAGANPLVLHGPVGTGKTHLLEGVYAGLRKTWPDARPLYVTAEDFTNRFVQAMRLGKIGAFRRQFRECSALLLDDLHFLATKRATQEEFLHTFDALVSDGRQVVVTTDCHPRLADELMPELTDRLLGGAVWGLLPPDGETRLEILRKKSTHAQPAVPDGVLKFLASHLRGNVRELEGAVNSVRHYAKVTGRPVDQGVVKEALGDLLRHAVRVVSVADVDAAVCAILRLPAGTLQSKARAWAVSHPRMLATYLCRKHTAATYGEISKHFGSKTHSTAVAAEKKVRAWLDKDVSVSIGDREWRAKELIERVERELQR